MIKDSTINYKLEEEKEKKEFLEQIDMAFFNAKKLFKWLEISVNSEDTNTQFLSGLITAKIIFFLKEIFEEIELN